jgi:hypothetical protein
MESGGKRTRGKGGGLCGLDDVKNELIRLAANTIDGDDDDDSPLLSIPVTPGVQTPESTPPSPWAASTCVRQQQQQQLPRRPVVPQPGTTLHRSQDHQGNLPKRALLNRCNLANGSFTAENVSGGDACSSSGSTKDRSGPDTMARRLTALIMTLCLYDGTT